MVIQAHEFHMGFLFLVSLLVLIDVVWRLIHSFEIFTAFSPFI